MRIFFLLFIFQLTTAFAQFDVGTGTTDCVDADFELPNPPRPNNIYECKDVTIAGNLLTANLSDNSLPLVIKATGTVTISGSISFEGQAGGTALAVGGSPGPGGGAGGNYLGNTEAGQPAGRGGFAPTNPGDCSNDPLLENAEGSGGGGGGLKAAGSNGRPGVAKTAGGIVFPGGARGNATTFNPGDFTLAGAGGGTGDYGCLAPNNDVGQDPGTGGGGGGGIYIHAAGDVNITGPIDAFGGAGGSANSLGGGGGGGSGGVIVIRSKGQIILGGSLDARGGAGGTNGTASTLEGDGGAGAPGVIFLQDLDGVVTGAITPDAILSSSGPSKNLESDISCGTIAKKKDAQNILQMTTGMGLVFALALLLRILFRSPKTA
jgi:hypothetical protein